MVQFNKTAIMIGKKRILVIDDSPELAACYQELLLAEGYEAVAQGSAQRALEELPDLFPLALILVDYSLPIMTGVDFVLEFKKRFPEEFETTPTVVFSCHAETSPVADSVRERGALFWEKSDDITEFVQTVDRLVG